MRRAAVVICVGTIAWIAGCAAPDGRALKILACQQVANSIDVQSVSQLDLLRKALGVAPDVDPLGTCRDLGVKMDSQQPQEEGETK